MCLVSSQHLIMFFGGKGRGKEGRKGGEREESRQFHLWGFRKWQNNGCIWYSWPTLRFTWSWTVRHIIISLKPPLPDRAPSVRFGPSATTSPHLDFFYDLEGVLQWSVHIFQHCRINLLYVDIRHGMKHTSLLFILWENMKIRTKMKRKLFWNLMIFN